MHQQILGTSHNDSISYISLREEKLEEVLSLMRNYFFVYENISVASGISENPEAIRELDELVIDAIEDGVSLMAIENSTEKIIGCYINKIYEKDDQGVFEKCYAKHPTTKAFLKLSTAIDNAINAFNVLQTTCYMEAMFGVVLPEFQNKGIAKKMNDYSFEIVQRLKNGDNVKVSLKGDLLPLHPVPTVMFAVAAPAMKLIIEKMGYVEVINVDFSQFGNNSLSPSMASKISKIFGLRM